MVEASKALGKIADEIDQDAILQWETTVSELGAIILGPAAVIPEEEGVRDRIWTCSEKTHAHQIILPDCSELARQNFLNPAHTWGGDNCLHAIFQMPELQNYSPAMFDEQKKGPEKHDIIYIKLECHHAILTAVPREDRWFGIAGKTYRHQPDKLTWRNYQTSEDALTVVVSKILEVQVVPVYQILFDYLG